MKYTLWDIFGHRMSYKMKVLRSLRASKIMLDLVKISLVITIASNKLTNAADSNATENASEVVKQDSGILGKMMLDEILIDFQFGKFNSLVYLFIIPKPYRVCLYNFRR